MTDISPTLPPSQVPEPLPSMVMGDAAERATPRHGIRGTLFIAFSYMMAVSSGVAFTVSTYIAASYGVLADAGQALAAGVWAVLQWRLAGEVRRFSRWGWYGAMAELSVAVVSMLFWAFALRELAYFFLSVLIVDVLLLRYFWTRRAQFDVSVGG
jgi:hypothetical protein